jgi:hypothetical protein
MAIITSVLSVRDFKLSLPMCQSLIFFALKPAQTRIVKGDQRTAFRVLLSASSLAVR